MNISQRKDIIVFVLIIILAFLAGYNGIYKYYLKRMASIKLQLEEERKKNDILGIIGLLERELRVYQERSFSTAGITPLLDSVSQMAKQVGIEIEGFNPLPTISREQYIEILLKVPLRCKYHQLGQFLSLIESNREFIWVKHLNMRKATATGSKEANIPSVDLTVSGLYLKE